MRPTLDDLDRAIVDLLREDGRMSCAQIARSVGYATARTVSNRIRRLVNDGFIKVSAVVDARAVGYQIAADIAIETEPGQLSEVADALVELEQVKYVAVVAGDRDLWVQVAAIDMEQLEKFLSETLYAMPGVKRARTSFLLSPALKDIDTWRIPDGLP